MMTINREIEHGNADLRIDCSRLAPAAIDELFDILCRFFGDIVLVGGDLIYARGRISHYDYSNVWRVLSRFDVTVD